MKALWPDYIGKKFGSLTVSRKDNNKRKTPATYMICKCECGKEISVRLSALLDGSTKSCGCMYVNPNSDWDKLIGKKINRWTVIRRVKDKDNRPGHVVFECKCDCGNIRNVDKTSLTTSNSKSCGCPDKVNLTGKTIGNFKVLRYCGMNDKCANIWEVKCVLCGNVYERVKHDCDSFHPCICISTRQPKEKTAIKALYNGYIRQAKERGIKFDIDLEYFKIITKQNCYYCNIPPSNICKRGKINHSIYVYNGLDRINPDNDYTKDNVVPCCSQCNTIKWDMSYLEFINKIKTIYNNLQLKE